MRRGSRKALSSKSWGNVKKRVDPLTKGGCDEVDYTVAFTPKGGCLLKRGVRRRDAPHFHTGSIHPQEWVLVEPPVVGEPPFAPTSGRDGTVGQTAVRPYKRVFTTRGACWNRLPPSLALRARGTQGVRATRRACPQDSVPNRCARIRRADTR